MKGAKPFALVNENMLGLKKAKASSSLINSKRKKRTQAKVVATSSKEKS